MSDELLLFDFRNGRELRDKGIAEVASHNETWMERAVKFAVNRVQQTTKKDFTGEDIRFACSLEIGEPGHPNAWGALTNILVRRKIIVPTGEYRSPIDRSSHARRIQVYKKP